MPMQSSSFMSGSQPRAGIGVPSSICYLACWAPSPRFSDPSGGSPESLSSDRFSGAAAGQGPF